MRYWFIPLSLVLIAGCAAWYFYAVREHATRRALATFSDAVATQNAANVATFLNSYMAPDAKVTLTVEMPGAPDAPAMQETFSRPDFLSFIDLTLYSLQLYALNTTLEGFRLHTDGSARATVHVIATGDDKAHSAAYGIPGRFALEGDCVEEMNFGEEGTPVLHSADCLLKLGMTPKL